MFNSIENRFRKLPEDRQKAWTESNAIFPLNSRAGITRKASIEEQLQCSKEEIKSLFSLVDKKVRARKKNIYFLGHSQGGVIAEKLVKELLADKSFLQENKIDETNMRIFTLGSPVLGVDGDARKIEDMNSYLKRVFRENKSLGNRIKTLSEGDSKSDPHYFDKKVDELFNRNQLPSTSTYPGLRDLSRAKLGGSTPPPCKICYGVAESRGFNVFMKDYIIPRLSRDSRLTSSELKDELQSIFTDEEKAAIDRLWIETLDNEPNDGQVPVSSQFRPGGEVKRYEMTHIELLSDEKVLEDILKVFDMKIE